ncbi:MAG: hypothetical protein KF810_03005 [Rhizobiaceae bacterium]|nr:hypothetical protein [Rhizobiaceae bacterium]
MADTGWVTVGTGANNADAGNTAWSNPGNITTASDAAYAIVGLAKDTTSQYLHGTNCDFSAIPSGATIDGVEARVRKWSGGGPTDHTIQLIVGGTRSGDNKSAGAAWASPSSTNVSYDYGGASDLWGLSLSRSDVVAVNFGLAVRAARVGGSGGTVNIRVPYIQLKVHYTEAAGNTGAFFALFNVKDRLREILKPKKKFWLPEPAFARAA